MAGPAAGHKPVDRNHKRSKASGNLAPSMARDSSAPRHRR
jgi:hypothetical protein